MSVKYITIPPQYDAEEIFREFDFPAALLLKYLHAGLVQLSEAPWIDDDYYNELLIGWQQVTGVAFRDTLPTYTVEVDGKPLTSGMVAETLGKVQAVRPPETMEAYLQKDPIEILGMRPTMSDEPEDPPTSEQQTQATAANMGGPPNTAGMAAPFYDTQAAAAESALYYDKEGAIGKAHAVIDAAEAQDKAAAEKAEAEAKETQEQNAENAPAPEVENEERSKHGKHKHEESAF